LWMASDFMNRILGAFELAADGAGQLVVRAATERSHAPRLVPHEGMADDMRPAQEERGGGYGSAVASLVAQRHRLIEAHLRASEIAGTLLQDAERDPGVGSLRIELGEIDLCGVDLEGLDLGWIEELGLLRPRRLLGTRRLGYWLGRRRHARLGGLGRPGRGFGERLPLRGLRPRRRTDAGAEQQSNRKNGGPAQEINALARCARYCSHGPSSARAPRYLCASIRDEEWGAVAASPWHFCDVTAGDEMGAKLSLQNHPMIHRAQGVCSQPMWCWSGGATLRCLGLWSTLTHARLTQPTP
jgi:hypothetical protein